MYNTISKNDLINSGCGYESFSDYVILDDKSPFNFSILKKDSIIFCKPDYLKFLFDNIKFSNKKYILITHHSDILITENVFKNRPSCIKKWYTWEMGYNDINLIHIPIGFGILYETFPIIDEKSYLWFIENAERLYNKNKNNKYVYCNFTADNYLRTHRNYVISKMENNGVKCFIPENKKTINGRLTFCDYCEDMSNYKFVACPNGNGSGDTHRTWEALYLGCIPITTFKWYKNYNLPILQIKDYSEVTNELLQNYLEYYKNNKFDWEVCSLSYWKNKIFNDLKSL